MEKLGTGSKIFVAGHTGLVGSAIVRKLESKGFGRLILRTSSELDLRDPEATAGFFKAAGPEYVFLAAAKVGGILANCRFPADFLYDNLMIEANVIHNAYLHRVKKLLFLGSSCIYPKEAPQPIKEEYLLTGPLEPTNQAYSVAKIAGIEMCRSYNRQHGTDFVSAMPTNLYGPNDKFDLNDSHVLPALIRKTAEAKETNSPSVTVWGTGAPRREFLHVDDLADAALFLMRGYSGDQHINVGTGQDISIRDLAYLIRDVIGYSGDIKFDTSKPDGMARKLLDNGRLTSLGWRPKIALAEGIKDTYDWWRVQSLKGTTRVTS